MMIHADRSLRLSASLSIVTLAASALALVGAAPPPDPAKPLVNAADIIAKAPADAWQRIDGNNLMIIDLADGQRVTVWLAAAFAPVHVANIRTTARAGWWSDATIYRVQDNYVTQWGDATEKKPPAPGINPAPPAEYEWSARSHPLATRNPFVDAYAKVTGFTADGWAVAGNGTRQWLPHCYGMVGVARNLAPDTGTGGDLYTVIGHAPRHLDRNIAVVGRIIDGMAAMSALPRGTGGGLGLYEDPKQYVPIKRVSIASDLPAAERPAFEFFRPGTPAFAALVKARANRPPPFFTVPANAADLCNIPVPVRAVPPVK